MFLTASPSGRDRVILRQRGKAWHQRVKLASACRRARIPPEADPSIPPDALSIHRACSQSCSAIFSLDLALACLHAEVASTHEEGQAHSQTLCRLHLRDLL